MCLEFEKCCFCIELRSGCLIIGYMNLVTNIILTVLSIIGLVTAGVLTVQGKDDADAHSIGTAMIIIFAILFFISFIFLVFTIVLLVGLHQHKRGHVKAYLIAAWVFLVLLVILFFGSFAGSVNAGIVVQGLLSILFNIYYLLVIRSYYLKMDDPANKPGIYNTA